MAMGKCLIQSGNSWVLIDKQSIRLARLRPILPGSQQMDGIKQDHGLL